MATHHLKCWPKFFEVIQSGVKTFDVRQGEDRQYEVGDIIWFKEWDPKGNTYPGNEIRKDVGYIMHGTMGLPSDVWVLGLKRVTE